MKTIRNAAEGIALIEQGAQWLTLHLPQASPSQIKAEIEAIIPPAQRAGVIVVLQGDPQLALNTVVGGVRLSGVLIDPTVHDPAATRELLGPHAIVGVIASTPAQALEIAALDVDYFILPAAFEGDEMLKNLHVKFI